MNGNICIVLFIIVSVLGFINGWGTDFGCPPDEEIEPCFCFGQFLECKHVSDGEVLRRILIISSHWIVTKFALSQSSVTYFSSDTFTGSKITSIELTDVSLIQMFDKIPRNMDRLEDLTLVNVRFKKKLSWELFSSMQNLKQLTIENTPLKVIDKEFNVHVPKSIEKLRLMRNKVESIGKGALSSFEKLTSLHLGWNQIRLLSRDMFPRPFNNLTDLDFRYNLIETVPDDFFVEMPSLEKINFGGNIIAVIPEVTFRPVWEKVHTLVLEDNPIKCDCRLKWILSTKVKPTEFHATCLAPKKLHGFSLANLEDEKLCC